ncbi:MAG TPA: right-handed parallel beta-helix repeat-containing protein [Planctomycetota bacterium]|jgi:predicted outer membrane repeat protein
MKAVILFTLVAVGLAFCGEGPRPGGGERGPMSPEDLIRQFDTNGDGKISRDEAPERMKQRWEQIDTDNDGFITLQELKARDARVQRGERPGVAGQGGGAAAGSGGTQFQPSSKFSVITIGTGCPKYDAARSGPSTTIQYNGHYFLVDMGNGTQARLHELGISPRAIDALLLTHHHLDHNEEFAPIFLGLRVAGGKVQVVGPPHTQELVDFTAKFYAEDTAYRLARRGRKEDELPAAAVREIKGGESFELGGMKITTTKVNHSIHTVAYRFDADGQSIVISGDLSYTEGLIELARSADVLVIDSGSAIVRKGSAAEEGGGPQGMGNRPAGDSQRAHGSLQDVCAMAQKSGAKRLVLTHIAGEVDEAATLKAVGEHYKGEVVIGQDLLEVSPTAGVRRPQTAEQTNKGNGSTRVFVNATTAGEKHDGQSWATAFRTVQDAIDSAEKLGGGDVWVAKGTYKPTTALDRNASIQLRKGVSVFGGFAGSETQREQRDWERNATVLSGDIGQEGVSTDNSYHVVKGADDAELDGFTISGGTAMQQPWGTGGRPGGPPGGGPPGGGHPGGGPPGGGPGGRPIHISPEIILSGGAAGSGGGMLNFQCAPTVRNCIFRDNSAGKGGAMYNMVGRGGPPRPDARAAPAPSVIHSQFINNHAKGRGGGVANDLGTNPTFRDCTFSGNSCDAKGGAMYNDFGCSPTLANCLFVENRSVTAAAVGNDGASSPLIVHCTFTRNEAAEEGAALYQGSGPANNPVVIGSIFWGNHCENGPAEIFNWHDNDPQVSGSCVQGGFQGEHNSDKDPLLDADGKLKPDSPFKEIGHTAVTTDEQLKRPARKIEPRPAFPATPATVPDGAAKIIYVKADATGAHDGKSWPSAFASLSDALTAAHAPAEVWIATGTYKPVAPASVPAVQASEAAGTEAGATRDASFRLIPGVTVYGGFRGTETQVAQRDWKANSTILSGDIGRAGDDSDNSYHVVIGASGAVLDGFTIRDGNANGRTYDAKGGGMINYLRAPQSGPMGAPTGFSPVVRNCTFTHNHATEGGAVYNYDRSAPAFANCQFVENSAEYGGAIVDRVGVHSTFTGCRFEKNTAHWRAGAVYLDYGARPSFTDCQFVANRSECHGGALATVSRASQLEATIALLKNCAFNGNVARQRGGAIAAADNSILGVETCTFSGNQASAGGGTIAATDGSRVIVINGEMTGNRSERGEADIATDASSTMSRNRTDWPGAQR